MNRDEIDLFLDKLELHADRDEGDWVMLYCPLAPWTHGSGQASTASCGIHVEDDGMSFYNCLACKSKGPISDLAKQLGRLRDEPELIKYGERLERGAVTLAAEGAYREWGDKKAPKNKAGETEPTVFLDERKVFAEYPPVFVEPRATRYLRRRGIGFSACLTLNLRYDARQFRVLFPVYFSRDGEQRLVGLTGRTIRNNKYINDRNAAKRGSYPKIRDYKGLEKELHLLGKGTVRTVTGNTVSALWTDRSGNGRRRTTSGIENPRRQRPKRFVIIVEGLFGLARLETIAPDIQSAALMGSVLTEGKLARLIERGDALYWLTDNDDAGKACLWGRVHPETGKHQYKSGALAKVGHRLPQFLMHWPKLDEPVERKDGTIKYYKEDPDELTRAELLHMIDTAEIHIHRGT